MFTLSVPLDEQSVLGAGIYEWNGTAPHPPEHYGFHPYSLAGTYGKSEAEEVAARLVTICQRHGKWAIVAYKAFWRMVREEVASGALFDYGVFSFIPIESARDNTAPEQAVRNVIDVGLHYLVEHDFVVLHQEEDGALIELKDTFFIPIEGRVRIRI